VPPEVEREIASGERHSPTFQVNGAALVVGVLLHREDIAELSPLAVVSAAALARCITIIDHVRIERRDTSDCELEIMNWDLPLGEVQPLPQVSEILNHV
jgi:hypothetical protein